MYPLMSRLPLASACLAVALSLSTGRGASAPDVTIPPLPSMDSVKPPPGWQPEGYTPRGMPATLLRLPRTNITRAKFPAIDFHVHAPQLTDAAAYQGLIRLMDAIGMG